MSNYNLAVVRELLGKAFSSGEITTLAFDLFNDVYQDFEAGMTRSQKILMIVSKADSTGRIPELLNYVQQHNSFQYGQYAGRLESAEDSGQSTAEEPGEKKLSKSAIRRLTREKNDLEAQWELQSEKVRRLKQAEAIETDVTRKFQIEHQLKEANAELRETEEKLEAVEAQLGE